MITIDYIDDLLARPQICNSLKSSLALFSNQKGMAKIHKAYRNTCNIRVFVAPASGNGIGVFDNSETDGIDAKSESITFQILNNVSPDNRPLTAWIIAHRMAHAVQFDYLRYSNSEFSDTVTNTLRVLSETFNFMTNSDITIVQNTHECVKSARLTTIVRFEDFINELFTMRSARDGVIGPRVELDGFCELFAQYIVCGAVRFNYVDGYNRSMIEWAENRINTIMIDLVSKLQGKVLIF